VIGEGLPPHFCHENKIPAGLFAGGDPLIRTAIGYCLAEKQHACPVQQLLPSQQSAEREVARAVPIKAAIAAIKIRYFIIPPVKRFIDSPPTGEDRLLSNQ